jgi:hypothetical protein
MTFLKTRWPNEKLFIQCTLSCGKSSVGSPARTENGECEDLPSRPGEEVDRRHSLTLVKAKRALVFDPYRTAIVLQRRSFLLKERRPITAGTKPTWEARLPDKARRLRMMTEGQSTVSGARSDGPL